MSPELSDRPPTPAAVPAPTEVPVHECWDLLRRSPVGRLAVVTASGAPECFPVNHVVDHGTVVFRTAVGSKLASAVNRAVAYEVDGHDADDGTAWSVIVKGVAREVTSLHEAVDAMALPLAPWSASPKPRVLRIEPRETTGRRFTVAAGLR